MPVSQDKFDEMAKNMPGMGRDPESIRQRVEAMEHLLERSITIPGVNFPIGLDFVIGLVPVIGDVITASMGAYIVWEAKNLGMSRWQLTRIAANVGIDTVVGAVPLVGDAFDLVWRSNTKNLKMIRKHIEKHHPGAQIVDV